MKVEPIRTDKGWRLKPIATTDEEEKFLQEASDITESLNHFFMFALMDEQTFNEAKKWLEMAQRCWEQGKAIPEAYPRDRALFKALLELEEEAP